MITSALSQFARRWILRSQPAQQEVARPCPVCTAAPGVLFGSREYPLVVCRACRHLYWDRVTTPETLREFYSRQYSGTHHQWDLQNEHRAYYREHLHHLASLVGVPVAQLRLADYGSSIPTLVHEAHLLGCRSAVAIDLDEAAAGYAREHGLTLLTPDRFRDEVTPGSVDVVRYSHVLEHLPRPQEALADGVRKLRPGGLLYITQPNFPLFKPQATAFRLKDSVYPSHLHYFSPLSLRKLLEPFPVRVTGFYSHTGAEEMYAASAPLMDLKYAEAQLRDWAGIGQPGRGQYANYPYYTGENSELYAVRV